MTATDMIKDATDHSFMTDVVEASKTVPVIVDFWAPWCGPCRQLMPVLERVVSAEGGKVKMVKINIDENPGIAGQMRVQSIPAVFAFKDGQPIDGFMGGQPESELKKFVARLTGEADIEAESEALFARALESLSAGDVGGAAQDLASALRVNPAHGGARATLARLYLEGDSPEQALAILDDAPLEAQNHADILSARAAISLRLDGAALFDAEVQDGQQDAHEDAQVTARENPALEAAKAKVDASPNDLDARLALAKLLAAEGDNEAAIEHLLYSVAKNRAHDDEAARKFLLTVFQAEGAASDLAKDGRARLSSILFA